jgi:hypothetical protein
MAQWQAADFVNSRANEFEFVTADVVVGELVVSNLPICEIWLDAMTHGLLRLHTHLLAASNESTDSGAARRGVRLYLINPSRSARTLARAG